MHLAYTSIVLLALAFFGCKSNAPKQQAPAKPANTAAQNNNANNNNNNQNSNQNGNDSKGDSNKKNTRADEGDEDDPDKKKAKNDDDDCDESSSSTRKVSYEGDIKKIIADNCISCHKTKAPILTTYAKVKAEAAAVLKSVKEETMPEDEPLSKADIALIQKWVDGGKLEKASGSSSSSDTCEEDKKSSTGTKKSAEEQLKELLETKAFKECKADDRVYDRSGKKCLAAKIATSYKCTKEGVIDAFEKIDIDVSSNMTTILEEGYEIEQCGELEEDPVVTFLKKDLKTVTAKFRRICASGSAACQ